MDKNSIATSMKELKERASIKKNDPNLRHDINERQLELQKENCIHLYPEVYMCIGEGEKLEDLPISLLEKLAGLDKIKPIELSTNDDLIAIEEGDRFAGWYREELIELIKGENNEEDR